MHLPQETDSAVPPQLSSRCKPRSQHLLKSGRPPVFQQSSTSFPSCPSSASHIASSTQYNVPFPKARSPYGNELRRDHQQKLSNMNSNGYMSLLSHSILGSYLVIIVRCVILACHPTETYDRAVVTRWRSPKVHTEMRVRETIRLSWGLVFG